MTTTPGRAAALLVLLASIAIAGCSGVVPATLLATRAPIQTDEACMAALLEGMLVVDTRSGLGIKPVDGPAVAVRWPDGWSVQDGTPPALIARDGLVFASAGDLVSVGGGFAGDTWWACSTDIQRGLR